MRWYDYVACIWFADMISVGLVNFAIIPLTLGVLSYTLYENYRVSGV